MPICNKTPLSWRLDFHMSKSILIASTELESMDRNQPIKRKIMSVRETVEAKLAEVVAKHSLMPFPNSIDDDDELDIFGLDSLAFMNLLMAIEKRWVLYLALSWKAICTQKPLVILFLHTTPKKINESRRSPAVLQHVRDS